MTKAEYEEYLRSPHWRLRKAAVIKYRGQKCEDCGLTNLDVLQLHHVSYARLGHEHPDDVALLCRWCHQRRHGFTRDQDRIHNY